MPRYNEADYVIIQETWLVSVMVLFLNYNLATRHHLLELIDKWKKRTKFSLLMILPTRLTC